MFLTASIVASLNMRDASHSSYVKESSVARGIMLEAFRKEKNREAVLLQV